MPADLRAVLRSLGERPGPSIVAIACLALGIGVNLALFGLIDTLMFRAPVGVSDPQSLVRVRIGTNTGLLARGAGPTASYPQYERVSVERDGMLSGLAAYGGGAATRDAGDDAKPLRMLLATDNYFSVLGVRSGIGRLFDGESARAATVAVLSDRYWRQSFGADPDVLGRTLRVNGVPLTVIGVAPPGFVGVDLGDPDLWVPMELRRLPEFGGVDLSASTGLYWIQLVGRLRPDVTLGQAVAMTTPGSADLVDPFTPRPVVERDATTTIPVHVLPLRTMFFAEQRGRSPIPLWALVLSGVVLLLACATVANLLLTQAVRRRRDVAIRLALGASLGWIVRTQMIESLLLASAALAVAAAVATMSVGLLERLPVPPIGRVLTPHSVSLGLGLMLLTPVLFALAPVLWTTRQRVPEMLKDGAQYGVASVSRLQRWFMTAQTAMGFVLLLLAGLFLKSLGNVRRVDVGMDLDRVVMASVDPGPTVDAGPAEDLLTGALDRIRALPGVEAVDVGGVIPFYLFNRSGFEIADGRSDEEQPGVTLVDVVGPDYFRAMGIGLAAGRPIDRSDVRGAPPVAVVSATLARRAWPTRSPLGSCLRLGNAVGDSCVEVVGVASDVRFEDVVGEPSAVLYLPNAQLPPRAQSSRVFVRTRGDRAPTIAAVRTELQSLDPSMPFVDVEPLDARVRPQLIQWEVGADLFASLGLLAALLGAVGLYSVVSFSASQRTRELGIRTALGAGRGRLVRGELRSALQVLVGGIACGSLLGLAVARLYDGQLYGLDYRDLGTYLAVAALLLAVGLVASLRPAWKASGADPAVALRQD